MSQLIYLSPGQDVAVFLRMLLDLADDPRDVVWRVDEQAAEVPEYIVDGYLGTGDKTEEQFDEAVAAADDVQRPPGEYIEVLRQRLTDLGGHVDKRWRAARLHEEIAALQGNGE